MDVIALTAILVALAVYVAAPLYRAPADPGPGADHRLALRARKDSLVQALRDLEADLRTGLLTRTDYEQQRAPLEREAAAIARTLGD